MGTAKERPGFRWWMVPLIVAGGMIGGMIAPAAAHITDSVSHLFHHADPRYAQEKEVRSVHVTFDDPTDPYLPTTDPNYGQIGLDADINDDGNDLDVTVAKNVALYATASVDLFRKAAGSQARCHLYLQDSTLTGTVISLFTYSDIPNTASYDVQVPVVGGTVITDPVNPYTVRVRCFSDAASSLAFDRGDLVVWTEPI